MRTDGDMSGGRLGVEPRGLSSRTLVWNFSQASPMVLSGSSFRVHASYVRTSVLYLYHYRLQTHSAIRLVEDTTILRVYIGLVCTCVRR